jgi:hypothetical protein
VTLKVRLMVYVLGLLSASPSVLPNKMDEASVLWSAGWMGYLEPMLVVQ